MKLKNNINLIIIVIEIIASTFFMGDILNESNIYGVYILISLHSIIYFFVTILKTKKIEVDKLDIILLILTGSTLIPLIFRTYVSLTEEIHTILRAFIIYSIYLISKNECKINANAKKVIRNTIIFSILILCIIGLDEITNNYLRKFKMFINYEYVLYDEKRIQSLFGYPNAMAIVAGIGIFLCIGEIFRNSKITKKIIYILSVFIMGITLILTYSRLVYIFFFSMIIIYGLIFIIKNKRIKLNKLILIVLVSIIVFSIYIMFSLNIGDKVIVKDSYQKILYTVEPNKKYDFKFDINAISEKDENFGIKLIEKDNEFENVKITNEVFKECNGIKDISITTQEDTAVMYIEITTKDKSILVINNCVLNGENFILKYKFLPTKMVDKIKSININNKSASERLIFIKEACGIIKNNWILGYGGNSWETLQFKNKEYNHSARYVHSYPIQTFLEYGIIGFSACLLIYIFMIYEILKQCKNDKIDFNKLSLLFAILLVLLHSTLDFGMSFFYINFITFILYSMIEFNDKKIEIKNHFVEIILIVVSIISIYIFSVELFYNKYSEEIKQNDYNKINVYNELLPFNAYITTKKYNMIEYNKKISDIEKLNTLKKLIRNEKYITNNINLKYINKYLKLSNYTKESIDFATNYITETEKFSEYLPEVQVERFKNLNLIIQELSFEKKTEYKQNLVNQLKKEIDSKEEKILDYKKCKYSEELVERYKNDINKIKNSY